MAALREPSSIETCLQPYFGLARTRLYYELLRMEIELQCRRGRTVNPANYLQRFPDMTDVTEFAFARTRENGWLLSAENDTRGAGVQEIDMVEEPAGRPDDAQRVFKHDLQGLSGVFSFEAIGRVQTVDSFVVELPDKTVNCLGGPVSG